MWKMVKKTTVKLTKVLLKRGKEEYFINYYRVEAVIILDVLVQEKEIVNVYLL